MSSLTRTGQKRLSRARASRWAPKPGRAGFICKSKAASFTAFCSAPVKRVRLWMNVSAIRNSIGARSLHAKDLHHFIAELVDDLDRNAARLGFGEPIRRVAAEAGPSPFVDFRPERTL